MKYIEKALEIVETLGNEKNILEIKANIFLNLSSVHSLRSKHDIALNYCSKAIILLNDLYNKILLTKEKEGTKNPGELLNDSQVSSFFPHNNYSRTQIFLIILIATKHPPANGVRAKASFPLAMKS